MHKTTLVITTGKNALDALDIANEFIENLIADGSGHDYHSPLNYNGKPEDSGYFYTPKSMNDPYSREHIITLLNDSKRRSLDWMREGIDCLNQMNYSRACLLFRIATESEMFQVFDYTDWTNGSPLVDTIEFNAMLKWSEREELKLWVTGYSVHF